MAQVTTGLRAVFSLPAIYNAYQNLVGRARLYRVLVGEYACARPGDRVLDVGCGPGDLLDFLGQVDYVGFDADAGYIDSARRRFGSRGQFHCQRVSAENLEGAGSFDLVVAVGILHHLDDGEARQLFQLARRALNGRGRLVTIDPCYVVGQSPVARWLISRDRGQNVRTQEQYQRLVSDGLVVEKADVRQDLLRMPYAHCVLSCSKSSGSA